ncbi:5452_t:CDS:2 [Racocetra fulgida]|uniref:5452_t:CDS:1 n=1 Tax=Racocetra fulgida TaxID=60492 RepID=A0A9N8Z5C1_9GLOM|nr:5452_t:CDS:2 [Racocetra fulgida]
MLVTSSQKKEKIQDITTNILNLKRSVENAYQDIYNALDELALKYDDNDYDLLSMEVIDITSKWASEFKNTTINFAKGAFSKKLELEEDVVEECKRVIQESQNNNTILKWIISESSVASLGQWVENLESRKKCSPNQNYKSTNTKASAIGDQPDIMFTVKISEKALELLYLENHTKLICLCKGGYNFVTTQKRLKDNKDIYSFLTILGINITDEAAVKHIGNLDEAAAKSTLEIEIRL